MNVNKYDYALIPYNEPKNFRGKVVLLIVKKELEKHIFKIEKDMGRILKVDFCFKNHRKLRVILVYKIQEIIT